MVDTVYDYEALGWVLDGEQDGLTLPHQTSSYDLRELQGTIGTHRRGSGLVYRNGNL